MMKSTVWIAAGICVFFVSGCMGPGSKPDPVPPKLVDDGGKRIWDRPQAFGPVPADAYQRGIQVCNASGIKGRAVGFHPAAMDMSGKPFAGGGFLCASD